MKQVTSMLWDLHWPSHIFWIEFTERNPSLIEVNESFSTEFSSGVGGGQDFTLGVGFEP